MISSFKSRIKSLVRMSAFRMFFGIFAGAGAALLFMRLWSSAGAKYLLIGLGGLLFAVLLLVLIYLLWKNLQNSRSKRMEGALGDSVKLKKQRQAQLKTAVSSLKDKWGSAMATLKSSGIRIYDIPWVMLIGEPQSGKTTTLRKSGLDFPIGKDALSGAGGTVNCDWWFTNDAVVIDTAGRFTMPVDSAPDKEEWHAFLKLLVKHRPKCPINNIVVTIPATALQDDTQEQIIEKAGKIREKLVEITDVLGVEFPVYIMVSKSDLITGFTEFCASLSSIENTQILGWNSGSEPGNFNLETFNQRFEWLAQRLSKWSLRRLRDLPVGTEADRIYTFPSNFRQIKDNLAIYLGHIFKSDKFHSQLIHRGCFFSSGLQQGQAIAKALEQGQPQMASEFADSFVQSRPYFIYNFYKKVFMENGLVRRVGNVTRRERTLKLSAVVFACIFSIVSAWYLWTGYNSLTKVLKPTRARIEQVMKTLVTAKGKHPTHRASQAVELAQTVEKDRMNISSKGVSYRFLKGRDNSVVRDLKNIEDAILMKGLFKPVFSIAGKYINKRPKLYPEKLSLYGNLTLGMGVLLDSPRDLYSLEPAILLAEGKDPWLDIETSLLLDLAEKWPKGGKVRLTAASPDALRLSIRQELTGLNRFWNAYPDTAWATLKQELSQAMNHYLAMLENPGLGVAGDYSLKNRVKTFKTAADKLMGYAQGDNAVFPVQMLQACTNDYTGLSAILEKGKTKDEKIHFESTVDRHGRICSTNNDRIMADLRKNPKLLDFMITAEGGLHPEFKSVHAIVSQALEFSPLFQDRHRQMVSQNPDRITGFLDAWDPEWHELRKIKTQELSDKIALLTAPAWKKEKLSEAISVFLEDMVWEADLDAAMACIQAVLSGNSLESNMLARDMTLPNGARTKWLEEKFTLFGSITKWLVTKYPSRPDISRGTGMITAAMLDIYKDYLVFWNNALDRYDPAESIIGTTSWKSFRNVVLEKRGLFLDPSAWPFNLFLENVSMDGLDSLKDILGEDRDENIIRLEKNIRRTAFVYSMISGNIGVLSQAQDRFYQCVDSLPELASEALSMLNDGKMADFKSLSSFRNKVNSGLGSGELLAGRLETIQQHGLNILKKGFASGFSRDQKALVNKWYPVFKRMYPFGERDIHYTSKRKADRITESFSTVDAPRFFDFNFDDILSIDIIENRYGIRPKIKKSPNLKKYRFMKTALQWKDFLYDPKEKPKAHPVKITMGDGNSQVSRQYTVVRIKGLHEEGASRSLRLRFSGRRYKSTKGVWSIDREPPIEFAAINEETGKSSVLEISGGHLALPAYIAKTGRKKGSSGARKWAVSMVFPNPENPMQTFKINLEFEWDEDLPEHISWTSN